MSIELEVQAVVDVVNISVGEIMGLRPGDIHSAEYAWARTGGVWSRNSTVELGRGAFDHRKSAQTQSRLRGGTESSDRRTARYLGE